MRSPNKAPPVLRLDGSTEIMPIFFGAVSKSNKKRRTISSTKELLPAPPVPVIPKTGIAFCLLATDFKSACVCGLSGKFSTAEI